MLASQVGAYQASAYAFQQQAGSGYEQARVAGAQEAPAFPQTNYSVTTRAAASAAPSADKTPPKSAAREGKGKVVDILA